MTNQTTTFESTGESSLAAFIPHLPNIILQRKWLLLVPAVVGLIFGIAMAFLLPVTYESKAVLLVEAPLLPEDVAQDIGGFEVIDQRMARIRQQVLSRPALIEIIQRNSLYETERRTKTLSEVIDKMRGDINITPVRADIQTGGNGKRSTIAFSMSFDYSDPVKAQAVTQALTQQVLQLDASSQSEQASNTVQFLTDQENTLQSQISDLSKTISSIKSNNGLVLSGGGEAMSLSAMTYESQLATLQQTLAQLRAQRQMAALATERDPMVQQAQANLASAQALYTDTHPDVIMAKQRLEEAKRLAKSRQLDIPTEVIDSQINTANRQIAILQAARDKAASAAAAQQQGPAIRSEIDQLQSKLDTLNAQYRAVSDRLASARSGKKADDEQQGERLSIIDPPVIPDTPISPNRPRLMAIGLVLGLGAGLFLIMMLELIFQPIRHIGMVTQAIGEPPLVVIPTIYAPGERKSGFLSNLWPFGKGGEDEDDD